MQRTIVFTIIANLIAAPFNTLLAYKVEQHLRGTLVEQDGQPRQEMKVVEPTLASVAVRSLGSEVKKITHMLKWLIILLIIDCYTGRELDSPFGMDNLWSMDAFIGIYRLSHEQS